VVAAEVVAGVVVLGAAVVVCAGRVVGGRVAGVRVGVGCVVGEGMVVPAGLWVLLPPVVSTTTMITTAITITAITAAVIHVPAPRFWGRKWSVQAVPSQNRSTFGEPPGSGYQPDG
jgi:hypothetical protein